jgi:DNA-binding IclR family transcriptional regulator
VRQSLSGVGVLDKAMCLLDALEGGPLSLNDLADVSEVPRATTHRLAAALEVHGMVTRDDEGRYMLGPRLARRSLDVAARPALEALRDATGESAQLYVRRGNKRVCVLSLESPHGLRTIVPVGAVLPLKLGSAGHVLRSRDTATDAGWTQSVEEREKGVASVSAPVVNDEGSVAAAVSVSGPIDRTTRQPGREYGAAVLAAARQVEEAMGWG